MSTSSSAARQQATKEIVLFPYQELSVNQPASSTEPGGAEQTSSEDEQHGRELKAQEAGRREGEAHAHAGFALQVEQLRSNLADALAEFQRERHEYYVHVEGEVVQLALAIARKILHREANVDPLLLAGMVRVLLERMEQSSKITVRVSPSEVSEFRAFFARHVPDKQPDVIEDAELQTGHCIVQTELGTTEVGPEIQLKEIAQGLLDLQAVKPKEKG